MQAALLPPNATDASRERFTLARRLIENCPPMLGEEVALTGSTARGYADDDSDLEINLWMGAIPLLAERVGWLRAQGATDVQAEQPRPDDSRWIACVIDGVPVEVGWQTYAAYNAQMTPILAGEQVDPSALAMGDLIASAIPLRTNSRLPEWQAAVRAYPDVVQRRVIETTAARWTPPKTLHDTIRLARRGESLAVSRRLLAELDAVLRILYAVNQRWQPSEKWVFTSAREFLPPAWIARLDSALGEANCLDCVRSVVEMARDALNLAPAQIETGAAREALQRLSIEQFTDTPHGKRAT